MKITKKKKILLSTVIVLILILSGFLLTDRYIKNKIEERKNNSLIVLGLFHDQLIKNLNNMNLARVLTYSMEQTKDPEIDLFEEKATTLLKDDPNISYIAFFKGDYLSEIYPAEYSDLKGKPLSEFSYSYTLAKVVKKDVVEGILTLAQNNKKVFLFASPLLIENEYMGEIIVAYDAQYVIEQFGLERLENAGFDYELWNVNELGEHKIVIETSNEDVDFSGAVKQSFSLPASWTMSLQPQKGWFSKTEKGLTYVLFFGVIILSTAVIYLSYLYLKTKEKIQLATYTDPNCNLLNLMGFHHVVNQRLRRQGLKKFYLLYIRLNGLYSLLPVMDEQEISEYYTHLRKGINKSFGERVVAGRLSDEAIVIAIYANWDEEKLLDAIEEFRLSLLWKKRINGEKKFIEPQVCLLTYPSDGENIAELIEKVRKNYQEQYEEHQ